MSDIEPIEMRYAGCRFRSRLEARWAVFFDHFNIRWEYEPQGFTFSTGTRYLPDFWLPAQEVWVEVKGQLSLEGLATVCRAGVELPGTEEGILPRILLLGPVPPPGGAHVHGAFGGFAGHALWRMAFFTSAARRKLMSFGGGIPWDPS
ncbi:hypothetical protein [Actinoplanes teichomyceticus]|nr:hypothetical protein [Actinoplanes teichomyceticus]GIF13981.1 hypothetical protein Ate01nite_40130 [Actinoplanes teichomyceticus]